MLNSCTLPRCYTFHFSQCQVYNNANYFDRFVFIKKRNNKWAILNTPLNLVVVVVVSNFSVSSTSFIDLPNNLLALYHHCYHYTFPHYCWAMCPINNYMNIAVSTNINNKYCCRRQRNRQPKLHVKIINFADRKCKTLLYNRPATLFQSVFITMIMHLFSVKHVQNRVTKFFSTEMHACNLTFYMLPIAETRWRVWIIIICFYVA